MATRKSVKETLKNVHKAGWENAKALVEDVSGQGDPESKEAVGQLKSVAADNGIHTTSQTEYFVGGYLIGAISAAAKAITGKENVFAAYPTFTALVGLIPFFGPMIVGLGGVQTLKFMILSFVDLSVFLFLMPMYWLYMIFKFVDTRAIFMRVNHGKTVREWEWFWNKIK